MFEFVQNFSPIDRVSKTVRKTDQPSLFTVDLLGLTKEHRRFPVSDAIDVLTTQYDLRDLPSNSLAIILSMFSLSASAICTVVPVVALNYFGRLKLKDGSDFGGSPTSQQRINTGFRHSGSRRSFFVLLTAALPTVVAKITRRNGVLREATANMQFFCRKFIVVSYKLQGRCFATTL